MEFQITRQPTAVVGVSSAGFFLLQDARSARTLPGLWSRPRATLPGAGSGDDEDAVTTSAAKSEYGRS